MNGAFKFKEEIPQKTLLSLWNQITQFSPKPLPNTRAFVLSNRQFRITASHLNKTQIDTSEEEYGQKLPIKNVQAITFFDDKAKSHIIIIRTSFNTPPILKHELTHIYKGEV